MYEKGMDIFCDKEAKYDMAVGHLLLKSFWANEAVFQMMMLSYNLFLLFKIDSLEPSEYRQQIKTFRLKYVFLAAKIIKTAGIEAAGVCRCRQKADRMGGVDGTGERSSDGDRPAARF